MTLLQVENLTKEYAATSIFREVAFQLAAGDRVGLVGPNGAGKTTLLRCLTGQEQPDRGRVITIGSASLGYLEQEWTPARGQTLWDSAAETLSPVRLLEDQMRSFEARMHQLQGEELQEVMQQYARISDQFERSGGFQAEAELRTALFGLGFSECDLDKPADRLSGGERIRLQLARLLFQKPAVLLLDEPTNHLDLPSTEWLEQYLKGYRGAILLVSHDRVFLDELCTRIFALSDGQLRIYSGNYSSYLDQEQALLEQQRKAYEQQEKEKEKLQTFINKFGAGTRASQAQSRKKQLERMEEVAAPPRQVRAQQFRLTAAQRSGREVLEVDMLGKHQGARQLFAAFSSKVYHGDRVAVLGPNGAGKSTLLKILCGELLPDQGEVRWGSGIRIGYFSQHLDRLNERATVIEELLRESELTVEEARSLLARFHLRGEVVEQEVAALSGGQRNRLSLAKLVASPVHILLLDEPTNHLDIPGRQALEEALQAFAGTVLFVTHDRYLVKKIATRIWSLENGFIQEYDDYEQFLRSGLRRAQEILQTPQRDRGREDAERRLMRLKQREAKRREAERVAAEQTITQLETRLAELSETLSHPDVFQTEVGIRLSQEYAQLDQELQVAYERWFLLTENSPDGEG